MATGVSPSAAGAASTRDRSSVSSAIRCLASSSEITYFDHEINSALSLAFNPVSFRLLPSAHRGRVPSKPLSFTGRAARRFQISQRCPPSCGFMPTGGRSIVAGGFGGLARWLDVDYIVEEWPILRSKPSSKVTSGCSF